MPGSPARFPSPWAPSGLRRHGWTRSRASAEVLAWPEVSPRQYLKFGEGDPLTERVQAQGWNAAKFGVNSGPMAHLALRLAPGAGTPARLKLNLKLRGSKAAPLRIELNGVPHVVTATDQMTNHFLPLPGDLAGGDPLSIAMTTHLPEETDPSRGDAELPHVILRGLEILPGT